LRIFEHVKEKIMPFEIGDLNRAKTALNKRLMVNVVNVVSPFS